MSDERFCDASANAVTTSMTINGTWDDQPDYANLVGKDFTCTDISGLKDGTYTIEAVRSLGWQGMALRLAGVPDEVTVRFMGDEIKSVSVPLRGIE